MRKLMRRVGEWIHKIEQAVVGFVKAVVGSIIGVIQLCFIVVYHASGLHARHLAERLWQEKYGEIPDGCCLAYGWHENEAGHKVKGCYLKEVMPK